MSRLLVFCACLLAATTTYASHHLTLSHEQDPGSFIAVNVTDSNVGKQYAFSLCKAPNTTHCSRIGLQEYFTEQILLSMQKSYLSMGKMVLWTELSTIAITALSFALLWSRPTLAVKVQDKVKSTASIHQAIIAENMGYAAKVLSFCYSNWMTMGLAYYNLKDEIVSRFQTMVYLTARFLSPAEHLRAYTLLHDITGSSGTLIYTKRESRSFGEYFYRYPVDNLSHLRDLIENILVVAKD